MGSQEMRKEDSGVDDLEGGRKEEKFGGESSKKLKKSDTKILSLRLCGMLVAYECLMLGCWFLPLLLAPALLCPACCAREGRRGRKWCADTRR